MQDPYFRIAILTGVVGFPRLCPELWRQHRVRQGAVRDPHYTMPSTAEFSRPCPGKARQRHAQRGTTRDPRSLAYTSKLAAKR